MSFLNSKVRRPTLYLNVKKGDVTRISIPSPGLPGYTWTRLGNEKGKKVRKMSTFGLQVRLLPTTLKYTEGISLEGLSWNHDVELKEVQQIDVSVRRHGVHLLELVYVDVKKGPESKLMSFRVEIDSSN